MWLFLQGTWIAGLRSRAFLSIVILGVLLMGVAFLSGFFSPRQPKTVALDVGLSGLRVALVLLNLFWIQDLVAREVDRRTVVWSLALPVARSEFLVGRFLGIVSLSALAGLAMGFLLLIAVLAAGGHYAQEFPVSLGLPYWVTVAGLVLDAAVVAAFALWISTLSTVAVLPLALGAAFAVAGKGLGAVLDFFARGADGDIAMQASLGPTLDVIRWVLPDLSRLDWRNWPLYGLPPSGQEFAVGIAMGTAFLAFMLAAAILAFNRRQFQ